MEASQFSGASTFKKITKFKKHLNIFHRNIYFQVLKYSLILALFILVEKRSKHVKNQILFELMKISKEY